MCTRISVALDTMISSAIDFRTWLCLHRYQPSLRALEQLLRIRMCTYVLRMSAVDVPVPMPR